MKVVKDLHPNDTVFPQDVPVGDRGNELVSYGGLTKRELFAMTNLSVMIQEGPPRDSKAANTLFALAVSLADGLLMFMEANPPAEPSLIEKVGPQGLIS